MWIFVKSIHSGVLAVRGISSAWFGGTEASAAFHLLLINLISCSIKLHCQIVHVLMRACHLRLQCLGHTSPGLFSAVSLTASAAFPSLWAISWIAYSSTHSALCTVDHTAARFTLPSASHTASYLSPVFSSHLLLLSTHYPTTPHNKIILCLLFILSRCSAFWSKSKS